MGKIIYYLGGPGMGQVIKLVNNYMMIVTSYGASEGIMMGLKAGLGLEQVQTFTPVRPGDRLVVTEEQLDKWESRTRPDRGIVRILNEVKNQNNELCVNLVSLALVFKRPA